jgi:DNA-binding NtrC family response regulator
LRLAASDARTKTFRQEIAAWVGSADFIQVCRYAAMDADWVETLFRKILKTPPKGHARLTQDPDQPTDRRGRQPDPKSIEMAALAWEMVSQNYRRSEIADLMGISRSALTDKLRRYPQQETATC